MDIYLSFKGGLVALIKCFFFFFFFRDEHETFKTCMRFSLSRLKVVECAI